MWPPWATRCSPSRMSVKVCWTIVEISFVVPWSKFDNLWDVRRVLMDGWTNPKKSLRDSPRLMALGRFQDINSMLLRYRKSSQGKELSEALWNLLGTEPFAAGSWVWNLSQLSLKPFLVNFVRLTTLARAASEAAAGGPSANSLRMLTGTLAPCWLLALRGPRALCRLRRIGRASWSWGRFTISK